MIRRRVVPDPTARRGVGLRPPFAISDTSFKGTSPFLVVGEPRQPVVTDASSRFIYKRTSDDAAMRKTRRAPARRQPLPCRDQWREVL